MAEERLPVCLERHADPASGVIVPSVKNARHEYVDRREMLSLAKACTNRQARMAIRIAFYSGMRLSEILSVAIGKIGRAA